jgi:hypothetical protein
MAANIRNGSVILIQSIITGRGGPRMKSHFNLYYLHWWTLTHYVFESKATAALAQELVIKGGGLESFERLFGATESAATNWHGHVRELKRRLP